MGRKVNLGKRLSRSFYARDTCSVARDLLGKRLVRLDKGRCLACSIVEAEAYYGAEDAASHAYRGRTQRNGPMFGPAGHSYVYFIYGMHWMFNVVAHVDGMPGAILIRAAAPEEGVEVMRALRGNKPDAVLANGPARLAQALGIDGALNDVDLCTPEVITIEQGVAIPEAAIACGPRVRVPGDRHARTRPWRFWIRDHPCVSK